MGTTFKCNKCNFTVRVSTHEELKLYQEEHNIICKGKLISIWLNYDKMTHKEIEEKMKGIIFRYGVIKGE